VFSSTDIISGSGFPTRFLEVSSDFALSQEAIIVRGYRKKLYQSYISIKLSKDWR
jgi:hypothetical protein